MEVSGKAGVFLKRLKGASLDRMKGNIENVHKATGKSKAFIFLDMVWCSFHYGVGYLDYEVFGFAKNRGKVRKTYMTMNDNIALTRLLNDKECYSLLNDKIKFLTAYGEFAAREWISLENADENEFEQFVKKHKIVFCKCADSFGGQGVERVDAGKVDNFKGLYKRLKENGQILVEQQIVQHKDVSAFCDKSVNTVRIVTLLYGGEVHFVYALFRMGSGDGFIDNICAGGMYTKVDSDGTLMFPAFCDKTGQYYDVHPYSKKQITSSKLPFFKESVELCLKAAQVEPRLGYIGWDVAITPNGPVLVEANNLPSYDMIQNGGFAGGGIRPVFESIIGGEIPKLR